VTTSGYQLELIDADGSGLLELLANVTGACRFDTLAVDATLGNAVPVTEAISSLMTDGGLTTVRSFGNRVAAFLVTITAPDAGALADGEAVLMAALDRVAALAWHVPFGASSFFDVVACWSEHQFDDLEEVRQVRRTFRVTFECLPFARSASLSTINWTGPVELAPLNAGPGAGAGWTVVSGSAAWNANADGLGVPGILASSDAVLRRTVTVDEYLWFKVASVPASVKGITSVKVNGTAIPDAEVREEGNLYLTSDRFSTVPVGAWRGQSVTVEFTLRTTLALTEFWTRSYPGAIVDASDARPKGIDVIDVGGTARTPCTISFTAPSGGAFVYTGPDPNAAIRERGAGESVYGKFTVSSSGGAEVTVGGRLMWFPQGDHRINIGTTSPQPVELNPNGAWPTQASGQALTGTGIAAGASQWAYPVDSKAAISFYDTPGAKTLISPSPALPEGYHGDAVTHEQHVLHPGRSGFAVLDVNGYPVSATITYYPRWKHHAAQ